MEMRVGVGIGMRGGEGVVTVCWLADHMKVAPLFDFLPYQTIHRLKLHVLLNVRFVISPFLSVADASRIGGIRCLWVDTRLSVCPAGEMS